MSVEVMVCYFHCKGRFHSCKSVYSLIYFEGFVFTFQDLALSFVNLCIMCATQPHTEFFLTLVCIALA